MKFEKIYLRHAQMQADLMDITLKQYLVEDKYGKDELKRFFNLLKKLEA